MNAVVHSADELMTLTGCKSVREYRAWLRKHKIQAIDAPAGPIVPHEALLSVLGLQQAQNEPTTYDPATTI